MNIVFTEGWFGLPKAGVSGKIGRELGPNADCGGLTAFDHVADVLDQAHHRSMRLISITANLHSFNGELNWANPIMVRLAFNNGRAVRVRVAADGESVILDDLPLDQPCDMGQYGRIEVHDFSSKIDPLFLNSETITSSAIHSDDGRMVGLAVQRSEEVAFCFWNYGDELHYGDFGALLAYERGGRRSQ
ncbi:hypothetical protein KXR53_26075 [Inquilinus limosus]|uniref:hypothetical protein n=1 Tax=Inquilinus limosus TaxID=171674 RepID=UPI003F189FBE